jgi:PAT family beta-lactamase induction signal transducer AmpG
MSTPSPARPGQRLGTLRSVALAMTSWRTASVTLMSFASGLPLGLVWIAIPDWMRSAGVDLKTVGLFTLVQAPWSFKFLWAPLMDRWSPGFWGRRRGWIALAQLVLFALGLGMAGLGSHPDSAWVVAALALAMAVASATQDIATDAYAVDVLRPTEQGFASGARVALYRFAMYISGGLAISIAARVGWGWVNLGLAITFVPLLLITWKAPEPEVPAIAPRSLRDAIWEPFLGFLGRPRALEILAFVLCYKLADNLSQALLRPFLIDMGYSADDRGFFVSTLAALALAIGAVVGGLATSWVGLGRALWVFGLVQIFSNVGYVLVAGSPVDRTLMYSAMTFESFTQGLGTGAFSALLLRLTQRRFSATQYALYSSLFSIPRIVSGPIAGTLADALGWSTFFWLTMLAGIPGLVLLHRFVPWSERDPQFPVSEDWERGVALTPRQLWLRGIVGTVAGLVLALASSAALDSLRGLREKPPRAFDFLSSLAGTMRIESGGDVLTWVGYAAFAASCGLFLAGIGAARRLRA